MALDVKDFTLGTAKTIKTRLDGSEHIPSHDVAEIADGADVALGAKADSAAASGSVTASLIAIEKGKFNYLIDTILPALTAIVSAIQTESIDTTAHDAVDGQNPLKIGFKAKAALSAVTPVASDDRTDSYADRDGALLIRPQGALGDVVSGNASNTDGTSTSVIAAAGAGIKQYLTTVILTNTSATDIYVEMKSATTVKATIPVPKGSGAVVTFPVPLPPNAANEAWNFDPSAAATTVYCTAVGFKSQI